MSTKIVKQPKSKEVQDLTDQLNIETLWKFTFVLLSFVFLGAFVVMIFFYYKLRSEFIDPKNCPTNKGAYAVRPSIFIQPLEDSECGGICQFSVATVADAINQCNSSPLLCEAFMYQPGAEVSTMWYVNPDVSGTVNSSVNVYVKQTE